jgi:hypothetical protein
MSKGGQRRRWSFSLRAMFVVVTLASICFGWVGDQFAWMRDRRDAFGRMGDMSFNDLYYPQHESVPPYVSAPWQLWLLGDKSVTFRDWHLPLAENDAELNRFRKLFPELGIYSGPRNGWRQAASTEDSPSP